MIFRQTTKNYLQNKINLVREKLPTAEVVILDKMTYAADPNSIKSPCKLIMKDIEKGFSMFLDNNEVKSRKDKMSKHILAHMYC